MYYEIENQSNTDIEITISGITTYKLINVPANRIIIVEKPNDCQFIDKSNILIIRKA